MQMWTLSRFLPLVIGDIVPKDDQHWVNFLKKKTKDMCGYLESLISDHHLEFLELYPTSNITLKFHSMIHMPRLILK